MTLKQGFYKQHRLKKKKKKLRGYHHSFFLLKYLLLFCHISSDSLSTEIHFYSSESHLVRRVNSCKPSKQWGLCDSVWSQLQCRLHPLAVGDFYLWLSFTAATRGQATMEAKHKVHFINKPFIVSFLHLHWNKIPNFDVHHYSSYWSDSAELYRLHLPSLLYNKELMQP